MRPSEALDAAGATFSFAAEATSLAVFAAEPAVSETVLADLLRAVRQLEDRTCRRKRARDRPRDIEASMSLLCGELRDDKSLLETVDVLLAAKEIRVAGVS